MEPGPEYQQVLANSVNLLFEVIDKERMEDDVAEMWMIAMQNVIACLADNKQFGESLKNSKSFEKVSKNRSATQEVNTLIKQLSSLIK